MPAVPLRLVTADRAPAELALRALRRAGGELPALTLMSACRMTVSQLAQAARGLREENLALSCGDGAEERIVLTARGRLLAGV